MTAHRTTCRVGPDRSARVYTLPGLLAGVAISRMLAAIDRTPSLKILLFSRGAIQDVPAKAIRSAGAPWLTWVTTVELAAKLSWTSVPGWLASKSPAMAVSDSVSDDAASTTTVWRGGALPWLPATALQPATPSAAMASVATGACLGP